MAKRWRRKLSKAEAGRIGGRATRKRHGIEHYRAAGKKGFMVTVARHWQGDKAGYLRWLRARGWLADVARLFDAQPLGPDGTKCIEIPVIPDELEDGEEADPFGFILASIRSAPTPEWGGL
jgi:hypothetical protein